MSVVFLLYLLQPLNTVKKIYGKSIYCITTPDVKEKPSKTSGQKMQCKYYACAVRCFVVPVPLICKKGVQVLVFMVFKRGIIFIRIKNWCMVRERN